MTRGSTRARCRPPRFELAGKIRGSLDARRTLGQGRGVTTLPNQVAAAVLRGIQSVAAQAANAGRRGAKPWEEHTSSDLLAAHRIAALLGPGERVLDVGCGSGHWLVKLRMFEEIEAYGVDLAPPPPPEGVSLRRFDGRTLPFEAGSFDATLLCYVLHHLAPAHARELLEEAIRVTRKRVVLLEDSLPSFGPLYRLRNACHRLEAAITYASQSGSYVGPRRQEMFLTHEGWRAMLGGLPRVRQVDVIALADLHRYAHHTMFVAELDP